MRIILVFLMCLFAANSWAQGDKSINQANLAYDSGKFTEAGALYEKLALKKFSPSGKLGNYFNAACSYALGGNVEAGLRCLQEASNNGWNSIKSLDDDTDLNSLRDTSQWEKVYLEVSDRANRLQDPEKARLITEDLHRFWAAHKKIRKSPELANEIF